MTKLRPIRHITARRVAEFFSEPLKPGNHVLEESKKLYEKGFPLRFVRNYHLENPPAELHLHEDDIFLCLEGSARLIIGGQLFNPRTKDGLTFLADGIKGGKEIILREKDVLHIPAGQPHQVFTFDLCNFMVVKVTPPEGKVQLDYLKGIKVKS